MKAWKAIVAALVIFFAGFAAGGLTAKIYQHRARDTVAQHGPPRGPWWRQRTDFLDRLERDLDLTAEQRQRIEKVLRESQERVTKLTEEIAPRARQEFQKVHESILAELNPEQKDKFEELMKRRRRPRPDEPPMGGPQRGPRPPPEFNGGASNQPPPPPPPPPGEPEEP